MIRPRRILAIGAHPDDVEIGCLGSLLRWKADHHATGAEVRVVILTHGERGGSGREAETRSALGSVGIEDVRILDAPDGHVGEHVPELSAAIRGLVLAHRPNLVLVHSRADTHQDHRAAADVVDAACRRLPVSVAHYSTFSATGRPWNVAIGVSSTLDRKLAALGLHHSQGARPYMRPDFLRAWHTEPVLAAAGVGAVELLEIQRAFG